MQAPNRSSAVVVPPQGGRALAVIGQDVTIKLAGADTAGGAYIFEASTPPGTGVPPHIHEHEDEILHVLEGEYEITLDGRTHRAAAGAIANFPRGVAHGFRNAGGRPARALFTVLPAANFERFFEELSRLPPGAPPERIAEVFERYDLHLL